MHNEGYIHTRCNNIIDNQDFLALLHRVCLYLEKVLAILLLERLGLTRTRQLASLAHRDEASAQSQRKTRSKQEPAGIQADNDVGLLMVRLENVQLKRSDEGFVEGRVGEERQDIFEDNAWFREIGELTKSSSKPYLKTGEFGGAGGMGGGVSGLFGGGGGILCSVLLGHAERKRKHDEKREGGRGSI